MYNLRKLRPQCFCIWLTAFALLSPYSCLRRNDKDVRRMAHKIYYLFSLIYALKKRPVGRFLAFAVAVCYVNLATRFLCAIQRAFGLAAPTGLNVLYRQAG